MNTNRIYNAPPLPFRGQKRYFIKTFKEVIRRVTDIDTVVDMFGGSGILSRVTKDCLPNCRVIYNDFDYYCDRLDNIDNTNNLIKQIRFLVNGIPNKKRISETIKTNILDIIKEEERNSVIDYITLSNCLCFSGNYVTSIEELCEETFYNRVVTNTYSCDDYLDGLEVVHEDYRDLLNNYSFDYSKTLFILDPPYFNTDNTGYSSGSNWSVDNFLDIVTTFNDKKKHNVHF